MAAPEHADPAEPAATEPIASTEPAEPDAPAATEHAVPAATEPIASTGSVEPAVAGNERRPSPALFADVVGQADAVAALSVAAQRPLHAYLLVGVPGAGADVLARGFAAALLCPDGGCGSCSTCRRVLAGTHPDLVEVERAGAALATGEARAVVVAAQRRPLEARRQVIVVPDVHQAPGVVPVLLKTVEEPPPSTVVVLTAETVSPELVTLASRCARVTLRAVEEDVIVAWLVDAGVDRALAAEAAGASAGSPGRARLLAADPSLVARRALWRSVPDRLDGTGATAAAVAAELVAATDESVAVLGERHRQQVEELAARAEAMGERAGAARKALEDRQRREQRRWRTDEVRAGLAVLARAHRDRVVSATAGARRAVVAMELVEHAARSLVRNPNERLLLQGLLLRLGAPDPLTVAGHAREPSPVG